MINFALLAMSNWMIKFPYSRNSQRFCLYADLNRLFETLSQETGRIFHSWIFGKIGTLGIWRHKSPSEYMQSGYFSHFPPKYLTTFFWTKNTSIPNSGHRVWTDAGCTIVSSTDSCESDAKDWAILPDFGTVIIPGGLMRCWDENNLAETHVTSLKVTNYVNFKIPIHCINFHRAQH